MNWWIADYYFNVLSFLFSELWLNKETFWIRDVSFRKWKQSKSTNVAVSIEKKTSKERTKANKDAKILFKNSTDVHLRRKNENRCFQLVFYEFNNPGKCKLPFLRQCFFLWKYKLLQGVAFTRSFSYSHEICFVCMYRL